MSWIKNTKQAWKLIIFYFFIYLTFFDLIALIFIIPNENEVAQLIAFILIVTFPIFAFSWLCVSIKCPECGCMPVWNILKTVSNKQILQKLTNIKDCPDCEKNKVPGPWYGIPCQSFDIDCLIELF